ncbi:serine hydrolase domain-containing protein [Candidatus Latescibacterota bacterium]
MKYSVMALLLALTMCLVCGCILSDEDIKVPYMTFQPEAIGDGWALSTPEQEGFRNSAIDSVYRRFYSENHYPTIHSLLIVRNGKLVAEGYCRNENERKMFHHLQSATKSITSLLIGIALDKGYIESVDQTIYEFLPEYFGNDTEKREITIHHVLTMETGLDFDNDSQTLKLYNSKGSSLDFVLRRGLLFSPGTDWYYGDGNPQLISGIITKTTGMTEEVFARKYLFEPLNITDYQWEKHSDGLTFGAFGLWLRPRDIAKIGKMLIQDGMWESKQIISAAWIRESTRLQSSHQNYGYYWYPMDDNISFYAEGHGGNLLYVVPNKQLAVVITADPHSNVRELSSNFHELFLGILGAIEN